MDRLSPMARVLFDISIMPYIMHSLWPVPAEYIAAVLSLRQTCRDLQRIVNNLPMREFAVGMFLVRGRRLVCRDYVALMYLRHSHNTRVYTPHTLAAALNICPPAAKIGLRACLSAVCPADLPQLGKLCVLTIMGNTHLADVGVLGQVHTLNLTGCSAVTDTSALTGVSVLDISYCDGINDVSALGRLHTLTMRGCSAVHDVGMLGSLHTLILTYCDNITDVLLADYTRWTSRTATVSATFRHSADSTRSACGTVTRYPTCRHSVECTPSTHAGAIL